MAENQYWASLTPQETVDRCIKNKDTYFRLITETGIRAVWWKSYLYKYTTTQNGNWPFLNAELHDVRVNDFRNLLMHKQGQIKNQAASWQPMAVNTDVTSLSQAKIAKNILEMYTQHKGYDHKFNKLVDYVCTFGEGFVLQLWDSTKGAKTMTHQVFDTEGKAAFNEDGTPRVFYEYEGDVDARIYDPINVIRDPFIADQDQNKWYIFRDRVNKWDLAARFPKLYNKIISKRMDSGFEEYFANIDIIRARQSEDLVEIYTFVHKKTPALPNGRIIEYIDDDTIMSDTTLNYDDTPFHRMIDCPVPGSNFSYTDAFDLLQLESLTDGLYTIIMTNQSAFGIQNILMPKTADINESQLLGNMNVIPYDPQLGEPKALQLCSTPKEIFDSLQLLTQKKGQLSGVNSTVQGNPPNDVSSGVAISLLQSTSVQYVQGAQDSYIATLSTVGTALINILKQNAKTERLIEFTGQDQKSLLQKFVGKDLSSVSRVVAIAGNPATATVAGKYALAEMLLQTGSADAKQLVQVIETGSLDIIADGDEMMALLAQQENEQMMNGQNVQASPLDDHAGHIRHHISLLSDISVRSGTVQVTRDPTGKVVTQMDPNSNPQGQKILLAVLNHIKEHEQYATDPTNAIGLMLCGYQSAAQQPPPGSPPSGGAMAAAAQGPNVNVHNHPARPQQGGAQPPGAAKHSPSVASAAGLGPAAGVAQAAKAGQQAAPTSPL